MRIFWFERERPDRLVSRSVRYPHNLHTKEARHTRTRHFTYECRIGTPAVLHNTHTTCRTGQAHGNYHTQPKQQPRTNTTDMRERHTLCCLYSTHVCLLTLGVVCVCHAWHTNTPTVNRHSPRLLREEKEKTFCGSATEWETYCRHQKKSRTREGQRGADPANTTRDPSCHWAPSRMPFLVGKATCNRWVWSGLQRHVVCTSNLQRLRHNVICKQPRMHGWCDLSYIKEWKHTKTQQNSCWAQNAKTPRIHRWYGIFTPPTPLGGVNIPLWILRYVLV